MISSDPEIMSSHSNIGVMLWYLDRNLYGKFIFYNSIFAQVQEHHPNTSHMMMSLPGHMDSDIDMLLQRWMALELFLDKSPCQTADQWYRW